MYWQGPELKKNVDAGKYEILVQSKEKNLRYVLAIGETEVWNGIDSINAILLIPELKRNFFEESPISFIFSPLGYGYILLLQLFYFNDQDAHHHHDHAYVFGELEHRVY